MYTPAEKWEDVEENGIQLDSNALPHIPVLSDEVLFWLVGPTGGSYLDCTLGHGGLAFRILERAGGEAFLIGIDQDQEALASARERLKPFGSRARAVQGNFCDLKTHLRSVGVSQVDGVVFDLGVSSSQLNKAERGFSFLADGPLDMRMDQRGSVTAADLLNQYSETQLAEVIRQYGEERYARRIARAIVHARRQHPLQTTQELVEVIRRAVPAPYRHGRIHYATRTFQALRIAVNRELEVLEGALRDAADVLAPGGRLCVISFHSLEDRIAKQTIRALSRGSHASLAPCTKKPIVPSENERRANPRARSAKLRVAERVSVGRLP